MNEQKETKRGAAVINNIWDKASGLSKKVADGVQQSVQTVSDNVQQGVQNMSDKAKSDSLERRLRKYNPLFPKEYRSKNFHRSEIIMITSDTERRNIDVCEGAIGWHETAGDSKILCIYSNWVEKSGITFVPEAIEGAFYCVDRFDNSRFIEISTIFDRAHSEKLAELENIAYCLGAKRCEIELIESIADNEVERKHSNAGTSLFKITTAQNTSSKSIEKRSGKKVTHFEGNSNPQKPVLKWFADDVNVKALIDMRCSDSNSIKSRTLILEGSTYATMNKSTAIKADAAIKKLKPNVGMSMEHRAERECSSKLIFDVEF